MFRRSPPWDSVTYWALDVETTGLDARRDALLAVGMVPVRHGAIRLGEAWRSLVRPPGQVRIPVETMRAHHIVPGDLARAPAAADVLPEVLRRLREGVAIVHHAAIDVAFLKAACRVSGVDWPRVAVVDTVQLLWRLAHRRRYAAYEAHGDPELNLAGARRALGLPDYPAHDPVADAISTAELFLVLRHRLDARTLREVTG
ncbi:MAG: 3'-5' exonuclease [Vicinamibacterales bacterium]|nr:3'-5' exonuclease [Vicinamibacterales bacterium]